MLVADSAKQHIPQGDGCVGQRRILRGEDDLVHLDHLSHHDATQRQRGRPELPQASAIPWSLSVWYTAWGTRSATALTRAQSVDPEGDTVWQVDTRQLVLDE